MPANVTVEFEKAQFEYQQASSDEAKLGALLKMQSLAPSHKGGENLRKDISKKISQLRKTIEKKKQKEKKKGSRPGIAVKKEGIGQIALIGLPNSGKSTLLNMLTGINTKVASYPFTTKKPAIGMMDYFGGKIQLIELPGIVEGSSTGKADGLQILSVARNADALLIIAKSGEEKQLLEEELSSVGICLNKQQGKTFKKSLTVNPFEEQNLEELKEKIFQLLDKIIIYTKQPGSKTDYDAPLGLPMHSTVKDVARQLHKDFEKKLRFARIWGSARFPGQRVSKDYELKNRDVVEVFA
jgi:small GTP-binding protein